MNSETEMNSALKGKRVLLTQSTLIHLAGSEIQVVELADYLTAQGAYVSLFTWKLGGPLEALLRDKGIEVVVAGSEQEERLHLSDFDLLWIQHQVLPLMFIKELSSLGRSIEKPLIFFSHMSPLSEVHIEFPYIMGLEDKIADVILFNSMGTQEVQSRLFNEKEKFGIYPNPAPIEFQNTGYSPERLKKLLIVSNHPPKEVIEAADILRESGIRVDFLGEIISDKPQTIFGPEILNGYDCVISIGKTVQDCLVANIPVYIYDRFGGVGYLNKDNIERTAKYTFSGRKSNANTSLSGEMSNPNNNWKSSSVIAQEIIDGYEDVLAYQKEQHTNFVEQYSIDRVVDRILRRAQSDSQPIRGITATDINNYLMIEQTIKDYHTALEQKNQKESFYAQPLSVFASETDQFSADQLIQQRPNIHAYEKVSLEITHNKYFRLDFGESPCLISEFNVSGIESARMSVSSDAVVFDNSIFLFMLPDPKLIIAVDQNTRIGEKITITCRLQPIDEVEPGVIEKLRSSSLRMKSELSEIERRYQSVLNSRWWRLGDYIRRFLCHKGF